MNLTLFMMLGYPGSGKTTFARQLAETYGMVRISSDDLRPYMYKDVAAIRDTRNNPLVFGALDYMTEKLLDAGQSVVYDSNWNRMNDRKSARAVAAKRGAQAILVWIKAPLETARSREQERARAGEALAIPPERYEQLVARLQEPTSNEKVILIDGVMPFTEQLQSFETQLSERERGV